MDVQEERYRKILNQYRPLFNNIINECPITPPKRQTDTNNRNLKYIALKATLSDNYPYYNSIYQESIQQIKASLSDNEAQTRMLGLRLARVLPLMFRIKLIEMCQNEITNAVLTNQRKEREAISNAYGYQSASDLSEFLLSVFQLTSLSEDIYFDVNQRIVTIFSRFFESIFQSDKYSLRNGCEVLRCIFCCFGYSKIRTEVIENKLIAKLVNTFIPFSSFINKQEASILNTSLLTNSYQDRGKNNTRLLNIILRCRELQARIRGRILYGFCCLISYLPQVDYEISDLLGKQILQIVENISQCDVTLQCFSSLAALVCQEQPYYSRNLLIKRWIAVLDQLSFKKEYLEYYILLLDVCNNDQLQIPQKVTYKLAADCLQLTKHLGQQFSRFLIYNKACKAIIKVCRSAYKLTPGCNYLLKIFQYDWFIDRINLENDLFKSQFLIALLHQSNASQVQPSYQQLLDLLDLAHRLIDWKCTSKEQTHIPTLKLAFDMYLYTLGWACERMAIGDGARGVQVCVEGLINRCNDPSIYFLFKFKLIAKLLELPWYQHNYKYLQGAKVNFQFIQNEIRVVMMPKNPKPIFSYQYSLTFDGEIESRKQIEYIKIIMHLLTQIPKIHQTYSEEVQNIMVDYHRYLNDLEFREDANKELINCLQRLQADYYFNDPQKYFLMACQLPSYDLRTLNQETNLQDLLLYSSSESVSFDDEINIFGPMSPVQLTIKLHPHPSYSSVYIHIKKNQWVQTHNQLKLVVSSGIEKKELPFESSILQIKIDRIGALHFQVWKGMQNDLLLGSGSFKIKRKLKWKRVDHLKVIDGIHTKAYFKQVENQCPPQTYLSCYYGEPIMIHILKNQNRVVVGVANKQIWNQIRDIVSTIVQDLAAGSAQLVQNNE